jgi:flavin reductase
VRRSEGQAMLARHEVSAQSFREAMSRFGAAVNIVTSDGPEGRLGFTATAVCSLSADPPSLLVCMNRSSSQNKSLQANHVICVNTLTGRQSNLAAVFSGAGKLDMPARFGGATWLVLETGAPALAEALIAFDCRIVQAIETATHTLLVAEVVALGLGEPDGSLLYLHRQFRNLHHPKIEGPAADSEDALRDRGAALEWL